MCDGPGTSVYSPGPFQTYLGCNIIQPWDILVMVQVHLCIALVPSGHTWVVCVIVQVHLFIALVCSEHTWVGLYV